MKKRSVSISGHRTSISIEDPFWEELNMWAAAESKSVAELIREIDEGRGEQNLSSAIRVKILLRLREK